MVKRNVEIVGNNSVGGIGGFAGHNHVSDIFCCYASATVGGANQAVCGS